MKKFDKPNYVLTATEETENYGKFEIGGLERGFGLTLGNALRRVLISSIPGSSVFGIAIPGVRHEFMAIDGVLEDVTTIVLNLKDLVVNVLGDDSDVHELHIDVTGPCVVTAKDITHGSDVEIVNGDYELLHVTGKVPFSATLYVDNGRGYLTSEANKSEHKYNIGVIPTDSLYTPVTKVSYEVVDDRNIKGAKREKLVMEITTNGAIKAKEALSFAAKILTSFLEGFYSFEDANVSSEDLLEEVKVEPTYRSNSIESTSIAQTNLSTRSKNSLQRCGIVTVADLTNKTIEEIKQIHSLGEKSIHEILEYLEDNNLKLREE